MKGRRGNPGLCGKLLDKSVEAYILALETINRLSIQYRVTGVGLLQFDIQVMFISAVRRRFRLHG